MRSRGRAPGVEAFLVELSYGHGCILYHDGAGLLLAARPLVGSGQAAGHILIVEDDAPIRRLVKMVLERAGFTTETAADGLEAVLKLGLAEYDTIVLDLMMPNLDGFTFLQTVSEHDAALLQKIVVTSAASPAVIAARLRQAPFAVVPKPFDVGDLLQRVRECVASKRA